jgi:4-hydroxy-2-oxoheptanedioate aldolase
MLQEAISRKSANPVKEAAASGRRIKGVHLTFAAPAVIEVLAQAAGLDFVFIDGEHGRFDWRDVEAACLAAEGTG